ncbi:MAG: hypothetical protein JRJ02_12625 [Deltaproteobacteria bacterium]|nr:hypothetical protein [Deltaproteobacteria bacterium]
MKNKYSLIVAFMAFFTALFFFGGTEQVLAQEAIAHLTAFEGQVELVREGSAVPVSAGMPIVNADKIVALEGTAEVEFLNGSTLDIEPQSTIVISHGTKQRKLRGVLTEEYQGRTIIVERGQVNASIVPSEAFQTEFESVCTVATVTGTTLSFGVNDEGFTIIQAEDGELICDTQDGWVIVPLESGGSVGIFICPPPERVVLLVCYAGTLEIEAGESSVVLEAGEQVSLYYNPMTEVFHLSAVVGEVETTCGGDTILVPEGLGCTCAPGGLPPTEPTTPTIDPCYFVEPVAAGLAYSAPPPPPPPPSPPASPFR